MTRSSLPAGGRAGYLICLGYDDWEPARVVDSLASLGYRYCEWSLDHYDSRGDAGLRNLVDTTVRAGLQVSELVAQQDFVTDDDMIWERRVVRTERAIRDAASAGVNVVNVVAGPNLWEAGAKRVPADLSLAHAWSQVFRAFDRVVPLAEKEGVDLAFEACWGTLCDDLYSTQYLFSQFDSPCLGINLDPSHYVLRRQAVDWVIEHWADRIRHVHIKDVAGEPGMEGETFIFPLIGEGRTDWRLLLSALERIGYDGALSIEFEAYRYYEQVLGRDPEAAARVALAAFSSIWDQAVLVPAEVNL